MTPSADRQIGDQLVSTGQPAVAYYPPGSSDGPRELRDFEFLWILQGGADWECGGAVTALAPGTLALLCPGVDHRFGWDRRRATRVGYLRFRLGPCGDTSRWPKTRATSRDDPMRGLTRYLLWLGSTQPVGWQQRAHDATALLVTVFVHGPLPGQCEYSTLPTALDPVLDHVRASWAGGSLRPVTRAELARAGAMSPGHLSRLFREHCDVGVVAAFELLRLMHAESLLVRSNMSVRSIATACGFADPYHFSHRFKAAYGVSPRAFRDHAGQSEPREWATPVMRLLAHRIWGGPPPVHRTSAP